MKKNGLLKLIIIIMIAICVFCVFEFQNYMRNIYGSDQQGIGTTEEQVKNYLSDKIAPKGMSKLYGEYNGKNSLNDLYRSLYIVSRELIDLSKEKINNVDKYYEKNKIEIKNTFGITSLEDFKKLQDYVKKIGKLKEYKSAAIDTDSIKSQKKYMEFDITFVYDGNKNLKFNVRFMNSNSESALVKYKVIE